MTDPLEERLRSHLVTAASGIDAEADPAMLLARSARSGMRRRSMVLGAVVVAVVFSIAGVAAGNELSPSATSASVAKGVVRRGSGGVEAVAGTGSGGPMVPGAPSLLPSQPDVGAHDTLLFTRTTTSGVTIRVYQSGSTATGCSGPTVCPVAQATVGAGMASTSPGCEQLLVEVSTAAAVGMGSVFDPSPSPPAAGVTVVGQGTFGVDEGAPAGWVVVATGTAVTSVSLSTGAQAVDIMTPQDGVAVLAETGTPITALPGATIEGVGPRGVITTEPVDETPGAGSTGMCATGPIVGPPSTTTTTTTTVPPRVSTSTTTSTTTPVSTSTTTPVSTSTTTTGPRTSPPTGGNARPDPESATIPIVVPARPAS